MNKPKTRKTLYTKPELCDLGSIKGNTGWGVFKLTFQDWLTDWAWR